MGCLRSGPSGVISVGDSREEVEQLIAEAIQFHLEACGMKGSRSLLHPASRVPSRSSVRHKRHRQRRSLASTVRKELTRIGRRQDRLPHQLSQLKPISGNKARRGPPPVPSLTVRGCYCGNTIFIVVPPTAIDSSFEAFVETAVAEYFCLPFSTFADVAPLHPYRT